MGNNSDKILKIDKFDSGIFETDVYKIDSDTDLHEGLLKEEIGTLKQGIIFSFVPLTKDNIKTFKNEGFVLVGTRNKYFLQEWHKSKKSLNRGSTIKENTKHDKQIIEKVFDEVVNTMKKGRRFSNDPLINKKHVDLFYKTWLHNTFFRKYMDKVYIITQEDKFVGFVSILIRGKEGHIDLLCVLPRFQGKGYGSLLIDKAIEYLKSKRVERIRVVTEGENISSNALYQRKGFVVEDVKLVYHRHISN